MDFSEPWNDTCSRIGIVARNGNSKLLKRLIKENKPVDAADNRGWRPLHEAAAVSPNVECLEVLLKHDKTDVNWLTHEGETALLLACKRRQGSSANEFVNLLLQSGADPNIVDNEEDSPLLKALRNENRYVVEQLLSAGADVNARDCGRWSPLHEAATKKDPYFIQCLLNRNANISIQDECGMTPLFTAAQHGSKECLEELLLAAKNKGEECVVNIGAEDWATPLMIAAQQGFEDCVKMLVAHGANADLTTTDHATALHLATQCNNKSCLEILIQNMDLENLIAKFHPQTYEENCMICPLHLAVEWRSHECLEVLLSAGFSPDSLYYTDSTAIDDMPESPRFVVNRCFRNSMIYETALSYAVGKGDSISMSILLAAGASCYPPVHKAFNPLLRAILNSQFGAMNLLIGHGADVNLLRTPTSQSETFLLSLFLDKCFVHQLLYHGCDPNLCFRPQSDLELFKYCAKHYIAKWKSEEEFVTLMFRFLVLSKRVRAVFRSVVVDESCLPVDLDSPSSLKQVCTVYLRQKIYSLYGTKMPGIFERLNLPTSLTSHLACHDLNCRPE